MTRRSRRAARWGPCSEGGASACSTTTTIPATGTTHSKSTRCSRPCGTASIREGSSSTESTGARRCIARADEARDPVPRRISLLLHQFGQLVFDGLAPDLVTLGLWVQVIRPERLREEDALAVQEFCADVQV